MYTECNGLNPKALAPSVLNIKEKELKEMVKANQRFIEHVYSENMNTIAFKILLRNFQKKAKNRKNELATTKNDAKPVKPLKKQKKTKK